MTTANSRTADHPIDALFLERWSPRAFTGEAVPQADLMTMIEAARWAPSGYNSQPWRFVYALRDTPAWAYTFLAIRFIGLALVVPVIEEFFLRGFFMRLAISERWWEVPFGALTPLAAVVGTVFPMLMHPAELVAAAAWFSLVTWLMHRTRNIWDCVAAHAVTNFLLGVYVVTQGQWQLW